MITTEKILGYLSTAIAVITIIFSVFVVIGEMKRPKDPFKRILFSECSDKYKEADKKILSESDIEADEEECIFFPASLAEQNQFTSHIFRNGYLNDHQYLFFGKKGVLIKKEAGNDLKTIAETIFDCLIKENCSAEEVDPGMKLTVTLELIDKKGETQASITFEEESFSQILKNSNKLLNEMVAIKELEITDLRFITIFHGKYGYVENKDSEFISDLMKRGVDGLYLKSRGAKIRLLPHEYNDNPVAVISRKGRQYGLEKDEIKKDEASVYIYRTVQYGQKNNRMIKWLGRYSASKSDYSDKLSARLISKHIRNSADSNGFFDQEIDVFTGKSKKSGESLLIQAFAAKALLIYGLTMDDEESVEYASKSILRLLKTTTTPTTLDKALLYNLLKICGDECNSSVSDIHNLKITYREAGQYISENPIYTGLIINGLPDADDRNIYELIEKSFEAFKDLDNGDKIRYLGYLFTADFKNRPLTQKVIEEIISETRSFLESAKFDHRGFNDFRGGIGTEDRLYPGALFTSIIANGLANLVSLGINDPLIIETEAETGNFLRYLIVTDDDTDHWGTPSAKFKVQGGLRSHIRSDYVRLLNSSLALEYFVNRIGAKRDR